MRPRLLILMLALIAARPASALNDGMLSLPLRALDAPGWGVSISQRSFDRSLWLDDQGGWVVMNGAERIVDSDGLTKTARGFEFDARVAWQLGPRDALSLTLPWYLQEFSPPTGSGLPSALNDAAVRRGEGPGDLLLGWRHVLWEAGPPRSQARLGGFARLSIPTGLGPFQAAHPLVATGSGSFMGNVGGKLEGRAGDWELRLSVAGWFDAGAQHDIPLGSVLAYRSDPLGPLTLPGGRAYTRRDPDLDLGADLEYTWYQDEDSKHSLLLEARYRRRGKIQVEGVALEGSQGVDIDVMPQAVFGFSHGLSMRLGWSLPGFYNENRAMTYWGELLARLDMDF